MAGERKILQHMLLVIAEAQILYLQRVIETGCCPALEAFGMALGVIQHAQHAAESVARIHHPEHEAIDAEQQRAGANEQQPDDEQMVHGQLPPNERHIEPKSDNKRRNRFQNLRRQIRHDELVTEALLHVSRLRPHKAQQLRRAAHAADGANVGEHIGKARGKAGSGQRISLGRSPAHANNGAEPPKYHAPQRQGQ